LAVKPTVQMVKRDSPWLKALDFIRVFE